MKMSFINIYYEQIKDQFYYGIVDDFKLVIDKNTGCFNATKLCNLGCKQFKQWKCFEKSQELIKYIINNRDTNSHIGFYEVKGDNKDDTIKQITGQYVSREIILDISSWISVEFYIKCNDIIINYYKKNFDYKIKEIEERYSEHPIKYDKIDDIIVKINKILKMVEIQNNTLDEIEEQLEETNYKIDSLTETVEELILPNRNILYRLY
ncbi:N1R/p28-like protein [Choristoneura biennis entomopoxvirus]|uniref:N1R/p28-like protein n=1 Tax=Choristoneura biennis entomopoxvirus TaxID=10288 RepID=A0A916KPC2_CBEPV|nr:N1R/p28-like protein [Choristoneura biennis entomopoxvirus]CCU55622.1 N1R/p28-like protein [Choristoneura biennis entomopoxvirus]